MSPFIPSADRSASLLLTTVGLILALAIRPFWLGAHVSWYLAFTLVHRFCSVCFYCFSQCYSWMVSLDFQEVVISSMRLPSHLSFDARMLPISLGFVLFCSLVSFRGCLSLDLHPCSCLFMMHPIVIFWPQCPFFVA